MATQLKHVFDGRFELDVDIPDFVSYLHYDNINLPIFQTLGLRAKDGKVHSNLKLEIRLTSSDVAFSEPYELYIEKLGSGTFTLEDISLKLLPQLFKAVDANRSAEIEFDLFENDSSVGLKTVTTEIFPMHFWKRGIGSGADALLLAAFSQPNDPAVAKILTKTGEIKGTYVNSEGNHFSPNTAGYQGDVEDVIAEVKAVYEALQTFDIRYSNPLPNFSDFGQPIRTPSEILETKAATCLDSALLIASVLEAINLHPVIITVPSHAFVGVWLSRNTFSSPVVEISDVAGTLKSELLIFETTTICNSENPISFEDACVRNMKWLDANYVAYREDKSIDYSPRLVTDVALARGPQYRIHSLPTIKVGHDGSVTVIQTELPKVEFNFTGTTDAPRVALREDNSPQRVRVWKTSLLDSSLNNPLLNRDRRRGSILRVAIPNGKLGEIEDLLQHPGSKLGLIHLAKNLPTGEFGLLPEDWDQAVTENLARHNSLSYFNAAQSPTAIVKKLINASLSSLQETGVNNLYMTFGSLTWDREMNSAAAGQVTSPLFLLPITLKNLGKDNFELCLDDSSEPAPNETLALALANAGVNVPLLSNPETDEAGFDIPGLLNHVREQVNVVHKKTNWVVNEDCFIGTFDFSTFHMWKDLNDNWETLAKAPLVKHLIETDGSVGYKDPRASDKEITDEELDKEMSRLPIESDAAQVKAVLKSLSGESFIIQGPPGTGKSQTITNLLARNLQEGKRVLFMSEKAAALGVVKSRLDQIGLGDYILDLHDKGTKPANIRNQLLSSLDASEEADRIGLDTASNEYETALRVLAKYPGRLHTLNERYGESVYTSRSRLLEIPGTEILSLTRKFVTETPRSDFESLLIAFGEFPEIGENVKTFAANEWSFSLATTDQLNLQVKDRVKTLVRLLHGRIHAIGTVPELQAILSKINKVSELAAYKTLAPTDLPSASDLALARSPEGSIQRKTLQALLSKLITESQTTPSYSPKLRGLNLAEMQLRLVEASNGGLFKGKKYKTAAEYLATFVNGPVDKDTVTQVFDSVRPIVETAHKIDELKSAVVGLSTFSGQDPFDISVSAAMQGKLFELESFITSTDPATNPNGQMLLDAVNSGAGEKLSQLGEIGVALGELFTTLAVTDDSVSNWTGSETLGQKLIANIDQLFLSADEGELRSLTRWSDAIRILQPLIKLEQSDAVREILGGTISYNDAPRALQRAYFKLLFEKLVDEQEIANFEGRSHDVKISQLGDSLKKLREYNRGQIAADVLSTRKFDATSSAGVTGALRAELTKQRRQLPIRKLMKQYWQTITQVTPVVAASPDSVARFLDIESAKFDLVVFDEASQIRVAAAIGALGRAAQAIIVGDTEQMPPTAMFKKSNDSLPEDVIDEEDLFNLNDQESILSMAVVSQIPSTMLTWHYRSNDELLIAFSNKYIYEGKLSSFPSPRIGDAIGRERKLSVSYEPDLYVQSSRGSKTQKESDDELADIANTNLGEAKRVVAAIQKRVKAAGANLPSIGVITMNEQQRALIEKLLDGLEDPAINRARNSEIQGREQDYLFVRALERVQGDERDTIFLSIGFAPTTAGGRLNMTLGPLVRARSERRLNVAVTRARKEMIVFTSFKPEAMSLNEGSTKGVRLLQKFLELADPDSGSDSISVASTNRRTLADRHRAEIAESLRLAGFKVTENLGLSNFRVDIAIADPRDETKCILGIMLDGEGWRSRNSASDREVLPTVVLKKNMKWPGIERIWLPMWLRDRDGEIARIKQAVDVILSAADLKSAEAATAAPDEVVELAAPDELITGMINIQDLLASAESPVLEPEKPTTKSAKKNELGVNIDDVDQFMTLQDKVMVQDRRWLDHLDHPEASKLLHFLIDELTKVEGPVSEKRAAVFVAKCFGFTTVQEAKRSYIIDNISKTAHPRDEEGFIYPKGEKPKTFAKWAKQNTGQGRGIAEISLVEISNAMAYLCGKTAGMTSIELSKQASLAFGVTKLTNTAEARMIEAERLGIKRGILIDNDGIIMKPQA